jgi:hypothetical protein
VGGTRRSYHFHRLHRCLEPLQNFRAEVKLSDRIKLPGGLCRILARVTRDSMLEPLIDLDALFVCSYGSQPMREAARVPSPLGAEVLS